MQNEAVYELLERQRNKAMAAILACKDECDEFLPRELRYRLRKTILDQINSLAQFNADILRAMDDDTAIINEQWLQVKQEIKAELLGGR